MTDADLPMALCLTRQADWNQTAADWRRFLAMEPKGCFIAEGDGRPVAVTVTCIFETTAWIAMVLVEASVQRQGIATALMRRALDHVQERGVLTVRLDATDAGRHVYEKLGFAADVMLTRFQGVASVPHASMQTVSADADHLSELVALDARAAGVHRKKLLARLLDESPHGTRVLFEQGQLAGFIMSRSGAHALQIGPCVASPSAGEHLFADMLQPHVGQAVYMDIPCDNTPAMRAVASYGLTARRRFTRMHWGRPPAGDISMLWASSGPEKG